MSPETSKTSECLRHLAANASIEMTPEAVMSATSLSRRLGCGRKVYVPFLPHAEINATLVACRRLVAEGLIPVPHLAARAIPSRRQLDEWLLRLVDTGAERVLLIAGDARKPRGPFPDTLAVLDTALLAKNRIRRVGVAGYPEGHQRLESRTLWQALSQKAAYARETDTEMWLVSQFAFEAAAITSWLRDVDEAGAGLPVWIGVPGPAQLRTLLGFALRCGVGASAAAVMQRPNAAFRLAARWEPSQLLAELIHLQSTAQAGPLAGIHIFTFGGVHQSAAWLDDLRDNQADSADASPVPDNCPARSAS